jgi:hypothetical protein
MSPAIARQHHRGRSLPSIFRRISVSMLERAARLYQELPDADAGIAG